MIGEDRHVTYREIEACLGITAPSIHEILLELFGVWKLCARWALNLLKQEQKDARLKRCKEMLNGFEGGASRKVNYIVTGDESWIYAYEPERKGQSAVWVFRSEDKPTKVIRSRSVAKKMVACFFSKNGHVATVAL